MKKNQKSRKTSKGRKGENWDGQSAVAKGGETIVREDRLLRTIGEERGIGKKRKIGPTWRRCIGPKKKKDGKKKKKGGGGGEEKEN